MRAVSAVCSVSVVVPGSPGESITISGGFQPKVNQPPIWNFSARILTQTWCWALAFCPYKAVGHHSGRTAHPHACLRPAALQEWRAFSALSSFYFYLISVFLLLKCES